ncbi:MAG: 30S ribosomal protein S1 [Oscillospiraceae bacterium]|nr:30S ribosomal protein S1 [Oscillospiraceae bacterium]
MDNGMGVYGKQEYLPEGVLLDTPENRRIIGSWDGLAEAALDGRVVEARAELCDSGHNLHVDMPGMAGVIPYLEGALGIEEGITRDIALISRVGKPVSFTVTGFEDLPDGSRRAVLSRREAQRRCKVLYINRLRRGDIIPARITRLETFGAFCDIGCGLPALMPIASISVSRISHPSDRFITGMDVLGVVSSLEDGRICLSQRELLGTWEENAALFSAGETVTGLVRSVEPYGVFVELTPNLAGLAEPREGAAAGQLAGIYIKSILPEKMKLKLVIIDTVPALTGYRSGIHRCGDIGPVRSRPRYFQTSGRIDRWLYSPPDCGKCIESVFI